MSESKRNPAPRCHFSFLWARHFRLMGVRLRKETEKQRGQREEKRSPASAGGPGGLSAPGERGKAAAVGHSLRRGHTCGSNQASGSRWELRSAVPQVAGNLRATAAGSAACGPWPLSLLISPPKRMRVTVVQTGAAPEPLPTFLCPVRVPLPWNRIFRAPARPRASGCPNSGNLGAGSRGRSRGPGD